MEHRTIVFAEGTVITPTRRVQADLVVEDGRIAEIRASGSVRAGEHVIDCRGLYVGPGLVDIHVHGGQGHDFVSGDPQEIIAGCEYHLAQGTTSIAPSGLSVPIDEMRVSIEATRAAAPDCRADIPGYHVEGMYLDQEYRGGHLAEYVRNPDPGEYLPLSQCPGVCPSGGAARIVHHDLLSIVVESAKGFKGTDEQPGIEASHRRAPARYQRPRMVLRYWR